MEGKGKDKGMRAALAALSFAVFAGEGERVVTNAQASDPGSEQAERLVEVGTVEATAPIEHGRSVRLTILLPGGERVYADVPQSEAVYYNGEDRRAHVQYSITSSAGTRTIVVHAVGPLRRHN